MCSTARLDIAATLPPRGLEFGPPDCLARAIQAPAEAIWNVIAQPGRLPQYHAYCRANDVFRWPGVGARDSVAYYSGLRFERDFTHWIEGVGFDLEIGPPPRKTAWISWRITPLDRSSSELRIEVTPLLAADLSAAARSTLLREAFGKTVEQYLDSLLRGLDQFVTTGQAVRKKQFGAHPIFAP